MNAGLQPCVTLATAVSANIIKFPSQTHASKAELNSSFVLADSTNNLPAVTSVTLKLQQWTENKTVQA
jgi:hypothetical protein